MPLNRLGLGVASAAAIDYALDDPYRDETLKQYVAGVNLSTTPFATWAGDVSVAVGAEYHPGIDQGDSCRSSSSR